MAEKKIIDVGEKAGDFILKDQKGEEFRLTGCQGKRVLLSFHPLAWTDICAAQMKNLEQNRERFDAVNTVAVGISVDSVPCKKAWAETLGIKETRLLSDFWPHGGVSDGLGLFRDREGISERAVVLIDEEGRVFFRKVYPLAELPDLDEALEALTT